MWGTLLIGISQRLHTVLFLPFARPPELICYGFYCPIIKGLQHTEDSIDLNARLLWLLAIQCIGTGTIDTGNEKYRPRTVTTVDVRSEPKVLITIINTLKYRHSSTIVDTCKYRLRTVTMNVRKYRPRIVTMVKARQSRIKSSYNLCLSL